MVAETVVTRPPQVPPTLAAKARTAGVAPVDFLALMIRKHPTFEDAAAEIGVSTFTLRRWRDRFKVVVKDA